MKLVNYLKSAENRFYPFRKWHMYAGIALVIIISGAIAALAFPRYVRELGTHYMPVYFFNSSAGRLDAESRPWQSTEMTIDFWIVEAINHMREGPRGSLSGIWPDNLPFAELIKDLYMQGIWDDEGNLLEQLLVITFSELYNDISPIDEALFRSALTLTLTGLPYVDGVLFRVESGGGEYVWESAEYASSITNAPEHITALRLSNATFTFYFIDESGDGLVTQVYSAVNVNSRQQGRAALEHLIGRTPPDGAVNIIPPDTRILDVSADTGVIRINLSGEFLSGFSGSVSHARLMIYSIVNTVLQNTQATANRVFFLINSRRVEQFHGVGDFHLGFTYNEAIMMGYEDYEEEYPGEASADGGE